MEVPAHVKANDLQLVPGLALPLRGQRKAHVPATHRLLFKVQLQLTAAVTREDRPGRAIGC